MTNLKKTKRALFSSLIALLVCFSILLGTTFAWFTDSVTSTSNVIQTGTLKVGMYWAEANEDPTSVTWKDAKAGAIFNSDKWEPGYVEAKHFKIVNEGSLALKYKLFIVPNGEVEELADVIDVYYVEGATQVTRDTLPQTVVRVGTLRDMINDTDGAVHGALLPVGETANDTYERVGEVTATIAFKMRESAGNEYQNKKIGTDFAIKLLATQYMYEEDSFNKEYDENAPKQEVANATELQAVLDKGGYAVLSNDITAEGNKRFYVPADTYAVLDLNGYTLTSKDGGGSNTMAIYIDKGAVLTLNDSVGTGKIVSSCYGVYVKQGAKLVMNGGTISVSGNGAYDLAVILWNSDFVMNGGTLEGKFGVWATNYYKDNGETGLNPCYVKIADGCVLNSSGYADVEFNEARDAVIDVPQGVSTYPTVVSTTEELQNALDCATNGDVIMLTPNVKYGVVYMGRPTKSNDTQMTCDTHNYTTENAEEFKAHLADGNYHTTPKYVTTLKDLTVIGATGATIDGVLATSGHAYGDVYDYVRDVDYDSGSAYYNTLNMENIVFSNVNFVGKIDINASDATSIYDGITFTACTFTTGGTASNNGAGIRYYNESNNGNVKNIVVENCTFTNCYQGIYVHNVNGVTVKECTFDGTGHNAIAIQSTNTPVNLKNVVITDNIFKNIQDRVVRFGEIGADSNITIQRNVATNSGDENGEVMKAVSIADGIKTNISDNTWNGTVLDEKLRD